jgi:SIR2-like domain
MHAVEERLLKSDLRVDNKRRVSISCAYSWEALRWVKESNCIYLCLMRKLLIVNGAGGSIQFGMPSVGDVDTLFNKWALSDAPLIADPNKSLYSWVKEELTQYSAQNPKNRKAAILNFESILYTIQMLAEIEKDKSAKYYHNRINPFVEHKPFPRIKSYRGDKPADGNDLSILQSSLIDHLLAELRERCKTLDIDRQAEVVHLRTFLAALKTEFEIGVINLNYDNVILSALPDLKTGFDLSSGEFERCQLYADQWNFCYHLHGSVHFDMRGGKDTDMHGIRWTQDLNASFTGNSAGRSGNFTGEGIMHLNSNIIAGLDKANQLLRQPFAQYFMQLDRLIFESDAILFIGYGFADLHLNKMFPFVRFDRRKRRKVVVLDYAGDKEDGLAFRHDDWTFGLFGAIPTNGNEMGAIGRHEPHPAIYYKNRQAFERSANPEYPLSVWYNGLLEACQHPDFFLKELR